MNMHAHQHYSLCCSTFNASVVLYRGLCPIWRSSSVQRFRQSFLCWWMFCTAQNCCFQSLLVYAVRVELLCPSKQLYKLSLEQRQPAGHILKCLSDHWEN